MLRRTEGSLKHSLAGIQGASARIRHTHMFVGYRSKSPSRRLLLRLLSLASKLACPSSTCPMDVDRTVGAKHCLGHERTLITVRSIGPQTTEGPGV